MLGSRAQTWCPPQPGPCPPSLPCFSGSTCEVGSICYILLSSAFSSFALNFILALRLLLPSWKLMLTLRGPIEHQMWIFGADGSVGSPSKGGIWIHGRASPSPKCLPCRCQGDSPVLAASLACVLFLLPFQLDLMMATLNSSSPRTLLPPWGLPCAKCGECMCTLEPLDAPARAQVHFFHFICLAYTWNSWEMVKIAVMPWAQLGAHYPQGSRS